MTNTTRRAWQITIETHSVTVIRTRAEPRAAYCERCRAEVSAFTPAQIATFFQLEVAEVARRVETGQLHLINTRGESLLVCADSLGEAAPTERIT